MRMKTALVLTVAIATTTACSDGEGGSGISDPNERVTCETEWRPGVLACDAACAVMPSTPSSTSCTVAAGACAADSVVDVDGFRGCCTVGSAGGELRMLFESCQ